MDSKFLLTLAAIFILASCGTTKKLPEKTAAQDTQKIEYIGIARDGSYIVSVTESGTDVPNASEAARKEAVRTMLFSGIKGTGVTVEQKPIISDLSVMEKNKTYFDNFFGPAKTYLNFAETATGQSAIPIKTKNGYKIKVTIIVKKDALRKQLENDQIIHSLSSGFNK